MVPRATEIVCWLTRSIDDGRASARYKSKPPFEIDALGTLAEPLHGSWTVPSSDAAYQPVGLGCKPVVPGPCQSKKDDPCAA
jgi:hypothetical protein